MFAPKSLGQKTRALTVGNIKVCEALDECVHILFAFFVDGTVTMPQSSDKFQQGRTYTFNCLVTDVNEFKYWRTPPKPARGGKPAIPSEQITTSTTGRRTIQLDGNNIKLKIEQMSVDDGGLYHCVVGQEEGNFTAYVDCKCLIKRKLSPNCCA